jgi:sulfite reductase (NADPH) hemoprotein beta-component
VPGKVIGPSFASAEVPDVIEALLDTYRAERTEGETFVNTIRRVGLDPFKTAANAVRTSTARDNTRETASA